MPKHYYYRYDPKMLSLWTIKMVNILFVVLNHKFILPLLKLNICFTTPINQIFAFFDNSGEKPDRQELRGAVHLAPQVGAVRRVSVTGLAGPYDHGTPAGFGRWRKNA